MKKTSIDKLEIYVEAFELSNRVWDILKSWKYFERDTLGKQLTRASDSVVLNIAEGFGRFNFRENRQFCFYARGSLMETKSALNLASSRSLISESEFNEIFKKYDKLGIRLNNFIKSINRKIIQQQTTNTNNP